MTRVWERNQPVTVREVLEDLRRDRSIAYTTVMTVLDNLHQKGWVRRSQEGRAYRYEAISTRAGYSAALMNDAWSASDNPAAALVAFFGMMSPQQTDALRDALRVVDVPGVRLTEPEPAGAEDAPEEAPEVASEEPPGEPAEEAPEGAPEGTPEDALEEATDELPEEPAGRAAPGEEARREVAAPEVSHPEDEVSHPEDGAEARQR